MGWVRVFTHRGVIITGSRSVRYRNISNEAEPEPMMTPARNSMVGTPLARRIRPTSARLRRWADNLRGGTSGTIPPR